MLASLGLSPSTTCFVILGLVVALFVWNRLPIGIVAIAAALALWATGLLSLNQALAGFGDPVVIFIATLFIISEALDATGVTTWAGQQLIARVGNSQTRLLVLAMLLSAALSALVSPNGAVAALMPMLVLLAIRLKRSPSLLLMPLAFAAHAGSLLLLIGTPISVLIDETAVNAGEPGFGFFAFGLVGVPLVLGTIAIVVLFGNRLLPARTPESIPPNLGDYARTMLKHYELPDGLVRLRVERGSPLIGQPRSALDLAPYPGATLVGVHAGGGGPTPDDVFHADDVLVLRGNARAMRQLTDAQILAPQAEPAVRAAADSLISNEFGVAEVVIPPRSAAIGMRVFPGMVTSSGDLVILAVQRQGEDLGPREARLGAGDTLLLQGSWDALEASQDDADVLVVNSPEAVRRQAVPMGPGAGRAVAVLLGLVVLLATGLVPAAVAGLLGACALVLSGVLSVNQAYRAVSWTTIVLVGGMIPLSTAMQQSGAADLVAHGLVRMVGDAGPYPLLIGLVLITAILGQLISNMATALVVIPVAVSAAAAFGVSVRPMLMAVDVMAAAAFLTPVATAGNMMVMGPGGYRFGDYSKLGLPLLVWFAVVAIGLVPLIWRF
ncbi:MAG: SLC13 family permease [Chloroflexi bacterium]|nr:SLC13 family permease [Chloroflexota bacterium]